MAAASNDGKELIELPHHQQLELCRTRKPYRQGRKLTAVKTYSICSESTHLLIFGVPKINIRQELKMKLRKFGKIISLTVKEDYPTEEFTECFHVGYEKLQSARVAKRVLDAKTFYGGCLHICYAPELETVEETRSKMIQRRNYVRRQLSIIQKSTDEGAVSKTDTPKTHSNGFNNIIHPEINFPLPQMPFEKMTHQFLKENWIVNSADDNKTQNDANVEAISSPTVAIELSAKPPSNDATNSNSINNKRSHQDEEDYVFKRKKKRRKKHKSSLLNQMSNYFGISTMQESEDSRTEMPPTTSSVTVYDKIDEPKVVKIPQKPANKIIMNIKTKLI